MTTSPVMSLTPLRHPLFTLPALTALGLLGLGNPALAEDMNQVAVVSSSTRTVGYGLHEPTPIKETKVKVRVTYDPVTLTTNSGVALLRDAVHEAAQKACKPSNVYGPLYEDMPYRDCVRTAVDNAQPQVARAIAKAENAEHG